MSGAPGTLVTPGGVDGHPITPIDFRPLDFERLWKGRERANAIERAIVRRSLLRSAPGRVLEVGPGGGRFTDLLLERFPEYVGIDVTRDFLARLNPSAPDSADYLAADVHRLPFRRGSFSTVLMVRVFNFLVDPRAALRELRRVLVPGGLLVMSYHPVPTLGTLYDDLRILLASPRPPEFHPVTLGRLEVHNPRRSRVESYLSAADFRRLDERVSGLDDFPWFRRLPFESLLALSEIAAPLSLLPQRFVVARAGRAP